MTLLETERLVRKIAELLQQPGDTGNAPKLAEDFAAVLAAIADQLDLVRNSFNALAPDLKTENEPRVQSYEIQWQNFLSESGRTVNELFEQWVSSAEKQCLELDYRANLEKATAQINDLAGLVRKISDCEDGFTNHLSLRSDLLQRSTSVRAKFAAYDGELKKIDAGMAAIRSAHTLKDFSEGISLIASSEFSASPPVTAAYLVQSLNADDETALRYLLGATNAGTWAFVRRAKFVRFVPEVVMPAEQQILQQLNDDPAVNASHQRYRLWLDPEKTKNVEWITTGVLETSTGWTKIMAWTPSSSATSATFDDHNYGFFDGQYRLTPTEPVYSVEALGNTDEARSYNSVGLQQVWTGNDSYSNPLLAVLDSIKNSREGSPLFRAYFFLRLTDVMKLQPDAWGLTFCPALRAHEAQIRSIVGEQFRSGDWFVPSKVEALSGKLDQLFASEMSVSYAKEADGLLAIARAASNDGLRYIGFVGLDGKPNYIENSNSGEIWGYTTANKQPTLQAVTVDANKPLTIQGMPLSPLFALEGPRKEYLARAGVNPSDPSFQGALPPLFQELPHR